MKRLRLVAMVLLLLDTLVQGQDTITVMHYNLLNYGNTTSYCTQTNNSIADKATAMGAIAAWIAPSILAVNEMGANSFAANHFLTNVLNINGITYYQASALTNQSGTDLANFLFYDSRKFVLHSQQTVATAVRDINMFRLYHNDPNLPFHLDTAFLYVISTHLKAGNSSADATERAAMAKTLMDSAGIWQGYPAILTGDFNLYTSNEQAWKNLTQPADTSGERFFDPVSMEGSWQDNALFAPVHTQSTHSSSNGCASSGGLDDRFDFILMNKQLKMNPGFYTYIPGSYKTPGNDGNHLNQSITSGTNTSAPANIIQHLYNASDHLPVVMKLLLVPSDQGIAETRVKNGFAEIRYVDQRFELRTETGTPLLHAEVYDLTGRYVAGSSNTADNSGIMRVECAGGVPAGCYLVWAIDPQGKIYRGKVMVTR